MHAALDPLPQATAKPSKPKAGGTLKKSAAQLVLYINPAAAKALKLYAGTNDVKVHDLIIEALEDWVARKGLREQVRATVRRDELAEPGRDHGLSVAKGDWIYFTQAIFEVEAELGVDRAEATRLLRSAVAEGKIATVDDAPSLAPEGIEGLPPKSPQLELWVRLSRGRALDQGRPGRPAPLVRHARDAGRWQVPPHPRPSPALEYMPPEIRTAYDALPDLIEVWRGTDRKRVRNFSWTTKPEKAEFFAVHRRGMPFPNPVIAHAFIPKEHVFYADNGRNEAEVVLDPRRLRKLTIESAADMALAWGVASWVAHADEAFGSSIGRPASAAVKRLVPHA